MWQPPSYSLRDFLTSCLLAVSFLFDRLDTMPYVFCRRPVFTTMMMFLASANFSPRHLQGRARPQDPSSVGVAENAW